MVQGKAVSKIVTAGGVVVALGDIFDFAFPPPSDPARARPPAIGPHFGVIIGIENGLAAVNYGETSGGPHAQFAWVIHPNSSEASRFSSRIRHATHFRCDTFGVVHPKYFGQRLGAALETTLVELKKVASARNRLISCGVKIPVHNFRE